MHIFCILYTSIAPLKSKYGWNRRGGPYHWLHVVQRDGFSQHHLIKRSDEETYDVKQTKSKICIPNTTPWGQIIIIKKKLLTQQAGLISAIVISCINKDYNNFWILFQAKSRYRPAACRDTLPCPRHARWTWSTRDDPRYTALSLD